jgi:selenide, water dikinase
LHEHPATVSPDLIVGFATADDAGVVRLGDGRALVQTVDFFTPVVDDAYDWGRIAAANALSDVYAMGGTPLSALQLVGWPRDALPFELLERVVLGGADVMALAGCTVVGGHSIDDPEPKYGFAVTGLVDPDQVVTNAGARPGHVLVLTKPIGTGIITTALKRGACPDDVLAAAVDSMAALNDGAAGAMLAAGAGAATDVTGYGLLGHLREMLSASGVSAVVDVASVPVLPGAPELLDAGHYPGGSSRNLVAVSPYLSGGSERDRRLLADAQTSGGLLIAVPADGLESLLALPGFFEIGRIVDGPQGRIRLDRGRAPER